MALLREEQGIGGKSTDSGFAFSYGEGYSGLKEWPSTTSMKQKKTKVGTTPTDPRFCNLPKGTVSKNIQSYI